MKNTLCRFLLEEEKFERLREYCKEERIVMSKLFQNYVDGLLQNGHGHADMAIHGHTEENDMAIHGHINEEHGHAKNMAIKHGHAETDIIMAIKNLPKNEGVNFDPSTGEPQSP